MTPNEFRTQVFINVIGAYASKQNDSASARQMAHALSEECLRDALALGLLDTSARPAAAAPQQQPVVTSAPQLPPAQMQPVNVAAAQPSHTGPMIVPQMPGTPQSVLAQPPPPPPPNAPVVAAPSAPPAGIPTQVAGATQAAATPLVPIAPNVADIQGQVPVAAAPPIAQAAPTAASPAAQVAPISQPGAAPIAQPLVATAAPQVQGANGPETPVALGEGHVVQAAQPMDVAGTKIVPPSGQTFAPPAQAGVMNTVVQTPTPEGHSALGTGGVIAQPIMRPAVHETVVNPANQKMIPMVGGAGSTFVPEKVVR